MRTHCVSIQYLPFSHINELYGEYHTSSLMDRPSAYFRFFLLCFCFVCNANKTAVNRVYSVYETVSVGLQLAQSQEIYNLKFDNTFGNSLIYNLFKSSFSSRGS